MAVALTVIINPCAKYMKPLWLLFSDVGSSGFRIGRAIYMITNGLASAMLFAYSALLSSKLLIINTLLVEAAGVEPASQIAVGGLNSLSRDRNTYARNPSMFVRLELRTTSSRILLLSPNKTLNRNPGLAAISTNEIQDWMLMLLLRDFSANRTSRRGQSTSASR